MDTTTADAAARNARYTATQTAIARSRALHLAERSAEAARDRLGEALADPDVDMAAYLAATERHEG